jgi:hypothetical protein
MAILFELRRELHRGLLVQSSIKVRTPTLCSNALIQCNDPLMPSYRGNLSCGSQYHFKEDFLLKMLLIMALNFFVDFSANLNIGPRSESLRQKGKFRRAPKFLSLSDMQWRQTVIPFLLVLPELLLALQACSNATSCPSSAPFCLTYATNKTLTAMRGEQSTQRNLFITTDDQADLDFKEGFCVQCTEDCNCGVNEFCGIDPDAGSRVTFPNISMLLIPAITPSQNFSKVCCVISPCPDAVCLLY